MIGKIIGAFVGDRLAKETNAIGGASGAALGVVASTVLRRISLPAMVALGVGGYVAKKVLDSKQERDATDAQSKTAKAPGKPTAAKAA
jgi:ABC-type arginine transport system permease subunit